MNNEPSGSSSVSRISSPAHECDGQTVAAVTSPSISASPVRGSIQPILVQSTRAKGTEGNSSDRGESESSAEEDEGERLGNRQRTLKREPGWGRERGNKEVGAETEEWERGRVTERMEVGGGMCEDDGGRGVRRKRAGERSGRFWCVLSCWLAMASACR